MLSRRTFLKAGLLFGGIALTEGFLIEPRGFAVERTTIPIKGLPPSLDGFTICQVTDIHFGPAVGSPFIKNIIETANALKPDLIALTGDYIEGEKRHVGPVVKLLKGLKARLGVVTILGNHDHYAGSGYTEDLLASNGFKPLQNSHTMIESGKGTLCVAGVRDYLEDRPDAKEALKGVPDDVPRILLSHHPDYAEELPTDERIDLVISGHTHGGQVRLPFAFAPILPSRYGQKYSGGLVALTRKEGTRVYVSRGIGMSIIPVRFNCPPELTLLTLKAA
ncbi:MAG: metallophosphoesterase [Deltaproteobacteria bacterium]|nr:metallophosphoesterase [Deltaproteobacteria bacterium]